MNKFFKKTKAEFEKPVSYKKKCVSVFVARALSKTMTLDSTYIIFLVCELDYKFSFSTDGLNAGTFGVDVLIAIEDGPIDFEFCKKSQIRTEASYCQRSRESRQIT